MDFYEVLDQVMALLKSRGRVTYRALKREFNLDDDFIADLKEEILYAHPVIDDEGRGLIWTRETEATPITPSQPAQPEPQPIIEQAQTKPVESPPAEPHTPDAERRQLTVMFCDLVGSTSLSGALDPEDLREVVQAYQSACTDVIQRYEGYVAQHLGDGILCYFGYPTAHEDDAQRAVRTGLDIIDAMKILNQQLEQTYSVQLAVRISVHTGLVVIGNIGAGERQEQLALGETPNIAARIQGLADPDTVVISAETYRLIQGYFDFESLGERELRGVAEPIAVHRVLQESGAQSRLDIASTRGLTPLVGREQEVGLLLERWEQAKDGNGQVILLNGEAGIGKSRLVQVMKDHVASEPHTRWECRSSPYYQNTALYPLIDLIQRTLRWQQDGTPELRLEKLEQNLSQYRLPLAETVPLFASLLSLSVPEDQYPPLSLTPQLQRQKMLESIVAIILELAERQSLLFVLEDGHWCDHSTLELLDLLLDQVPTASLLVLITHRPEFEQNWGNRSYLTQVTLHRLSRNQIESIATEVAGGKTLPDELIEQLVEKTDGVPLYCEEMTKAVLESGVLQETNGQYALTGSVSTLSIPATLQDSLMGRLDRLVTAKGVAQYGSVIGRQFSYELLQAVSELDETMLQHELGRLVDAELVYQRGLPPQATYTFKHALVQDTAYESLLRSTRQGYHRRIAEVLVERFPETAEQQPELLAHHCAEAGLNEQAVGYWQQAGEQAVQRSAHVEAISHLTKGLALLTTLPKTSERIQEELALQTVLGPALMNTRGQADPDVERVYARARALCQQVGETAQLFPVLCGLWSFYLTRAEFLTARELGEQLLHLAQNVQDPTFLLQARRMLGGTLFYLGEFPSAWEHLEQGVALYNAQQHHAMAVLYSQDPGVVCLSNAAWALWHLGYPDQALKRVHDAFTLVQELAHPVSLAYALNWAATVHQLRREGQVTQERAETVIALSNEQEYALWVAWGTILRGWGLTEQGQDAEGMAQMHQGLVSWRATGAEALQPYFLALLAESYGKLGQTQEGLTVLDEAVALVDKNGERCWEAELHRLKGELLLQESSDNVSEAETCFQQAISVAQNQSAKSWELRAATSLATLWQSQGKRDEARTLLGSVYGWFTEGFDTADLIDAKALLDELS